MGSVGQGGRIVKLLPLVRVIFRELQHSDLDLLATYRKIPLLTGRVEAGRTRLARLPERETHLALVEERYDDVRANVTFQGLDSRNRGRVQVRAELPLLYPLRRSNEDKPFLDTLPVHRYLPEHR
jgi:hypothetical protein